MFEQMRALSDDQLAIMGCVAALVVGGLITQLTYTFGPARRRATSAALPTITRMPQPIRHGEDRAA